MINKDIIKLAQTVMLNESDSIKKASKLLDNTFVEVVNLINETSGNIVITGMGKSGDIAKKIASTLSSLGVFSYFLHPSEALHGDLGKVRNNDVIIMLTHSGETKELLLLHNKIHNLGINYNLVSITSNAKSSIAKISDFTLLTHVKSEARKKDTNYFLTPTVSTTVTLAIGDAIACLLQELRNFQPRHFHKYHPGGQLGANLSKANL